MDKEFSLTLNNITILSQGDSPANIVRFKADGVEERFYFSVAAMYEILRSSQSGNSGRSKRPYKKRKKSSYDTGHSS
jgi:hypothetical protein